MSRASHVPYHQNVYDLLQIEPGESPAAAAMIVEHEIEYGLLPAAVWEWYSVPGVVSLTSVPWDLGLLWPECSAGAQPRSLHSVLERFEAVAEGRSRPFVPLISDEEGDVFWMLEVDDSDDPPVWSASERDPYNPDTRVSDRFSDFVWRWMSEAYLPGPHPLALNRRAIARTHPDDLSRWKPVKRYANGLWIRTPVEPFQPPVIDSLIDRFGEPERTPRPGNVTTYTFRPTAGTVRVTADEPALTGGLSAWWVHADTSERLAEFARLLWPWGTLRDTLRADTEPAREVLEGVRKSS